jgi:DNA-binding response OmpR family regulator
MRCLIVEDDPDLRETFRDCLIDHGLQVETACSVADGLARLRRAKYDLLLLDYFLPDGNSILLSDQASMSCPNCRIILLTGSEVFPYGENASLAPGIDWILRKPLALRDLTAMVDYAMRDAARCPTTATAFS